MGIEESTADASPSGRLVLRGVLAHFVDDPFLTDPATAFVYEPDGLVFCRDGLIEAAGPFDRLRTELSETDEIADHRGRIIMPGFIDGHIHYVQTDVVASHGRQLLDWLNDYTFVAEQAFADPAHAAAAAAFFCDELLRNGTTTALVFCAVYPQSVEALFQAAEARNMRLIAGKVLMDRNAPRALLDTAQQGYDDSKALLARWHGKGRALYAVTPRFVATSTPEQLDLAASLWREHPGSYLQSHLSENRGEIAWVGELFPNSADYLGICEQHRLVGDRSVLAHGVHLSESEFQRCHDSGTALVHCPTSNLFLGSGLFPMRRAKSRRRPVKLALGTDVGAGTSFSLLATLNEAYKISQLSGQEDGRCVEEPIDALEGLFLATLGGARALGLDDRLGSLLPGREADMVVLDPQATPLLRRRTACSRSITETLFALMMLGDDRAVRATYIAGRQAVLPVSIPTL